MLREQIRGQHFSLRKHRFSSPLRGPPGHRASTSGRRGVSNLLPLLPLELFVVHHAVLAWWRHAKKPSIGERLSDSGRALAVVGLGVPAYKQMIYGSAIFTLAMKRMVRTVKNETVGTREEREP